MIQTTSHVVIATDRVGLLAAFFGDVFEVEAHFANEEFTEFVLPSGFRVAFFVPKGKAGKFFRANGERGHVSLGTTVIDVDATYARALKALAARGGRVSGEPKDHPWGERSFLLIDPDGNRWEVTQSPSEDGMLVDKPWPPPRAG